MINRYYIYFAVVRLICIKLTNEFTFNLNERFNCV